MIIIPIKRYSLTRVKLTALYKQLMTKSILVYISTNRTLNMVDYYYHLANNNYTRAHTHMRASVHTHTHTH